MERVIAACLVLAGCAPAPRMPTWPVVPADHYESLGDLLADNSDWVARGQGWWVRLPVRAGETIHVDVISTERADVFLIDDDELDDYRDAMETGRGRVSIRWPEKTQHYTREFTPEQGDKWFVVVDNTRFPDKLDPELSLSARVRVFRPRDELAVALAARPRTVSTSPAADHDGIWRGKTSQSHELVLVVSGGAVTAVYAKVSAMSEGPGKCKMEQTVQCAEGQPCGALASPVQLEHGAFSLTQTMGAKASGIALRGTFTSTTSAFGELAFILKPGHRDWQDCPEMTGTLLWTAERS